MINTNDFDSISQQLSRFGLGYDSTFFDVKNAISDIRSQVKALNTHHDFSDDEILAKLCNLYNISAKITSKNFRSALKRYFNKLIDNASSRYQYVAHEKIFHCASQNYVERSKALQGRFYEEFLYDYSAKKKHHAETARHLSEAMGLASLSLKDGLVGYFLTVTLKGEKHYCSGERWDGSMPQDAASLLSKAISLLRVLAAKIGLRLEYFRTINIHVKDGTPHLHVCLFTDNKEKLDELLDRAFPKLTMKKHIKKIRNVNEATLYTLQEQWDLTTRDGEKRTLALKSLKVRTFSKSSNVRRFVPVTLVEACRKSTFKSKRDLAAVRSYCSLVPIDLFNYSLKALLSSALTYNFADCTRIYSLFTRTRNYTPIDTSLAITTSASIDTSTIHGFDHDTDLLQTNSQGSEPKIKKLWDKIDALGFVNDNYLTSIYEMLSTLQLRQLPDALNLPDRPIYLLSCIVHAALDNKANEIIEKSVLKANSCDKIKYDRGVTNLFSINLLKEKRTSSLFDLVMKGISKNASVKWLQNMTISETHLKIVFDEDPDHYCDFSLAMAA